jgi:hypothetical protein
MLFCKKWGVVNLNRNYLVNENRNYLVNMVGLSMGF